MTNRYYAVRETYSIPAPIVAGGGGVRFGRGIDMVDPDQPVLVPARVPFFQNPMMAEKDVGYEVRSDNVKDAFSILRTESASDEAAVLNTHFRASYGITNLDVAASMAREERRSSVSAYILLSHVGETRNLSDAGLRIDPKLDPLAERLEDESEAFLQFRHDFGTHYVETVKYGMTIAIRGRMSTTESSARQTVAANLSSGFGALRAGGSVDAEVQKSLHSSNLQITCEVNCGGIEPARPLVLQGFDEIADFLTKITKGEVTFHLAPVELALFSYWHLLDPEKYPRCRALLDPRQDVGIRPPSGEFGVPAGTVLAWHPPDTAIRGEGGDAQIVPPAGWALCNGEDGTPDLRDRFIRGTVSPSALASTGGAAKHTHKKTKGDVAKIKGLVKAATPAIVKLSESADHVPPFTRLVFIMKLEEAS